VDERDAYLLNRDQVVAALEKTLGQSKESCERWIDGAEESFALTVENFAKWVAEYLDTKGPDHRIVFLADEVGQFIGTDTRLMLNLQTITENLVTHCRSRAWVVVTSQEDIDSVLGEIGTGKAMDFSKIQGRFKTRLSLSSANVDEVIQQRLLAKTEEAVAELERLFAEKGDVIRNQVSFRDTKMTFRRVRGADDFVTNYPFVPYQFQLLQRVFESIRKAGATGLHLARGERSLLDAFQSAGKAVAGQEVGAAVPLYLFYPSIESFLDTAVKRTIDQARDNTALEPFDAHVLEVLFLIRYVDEMTGNFDNLVTLCLDSIDADRLALRRQIEASVQRLEGQNLISRSGENYFFLTYEERDIYQQIKSVELDSGEEPRLVGEILFSEVLRDQRKHRFAANKMDFALNRSCDHRPIGNRQEGALVVSMITPFVDDYDSYQDSRCVLDSAQEGGQLLIRLGDRESLGRELRTYLRTDKYLRTKNDGTLMPSTRRIHRDLADENRARRQRLTELLTELLEEGQYFANSQRLKLKATSPLALLSEALDYLVENTFTRMKYLEVLIENPLPEIQAVIRSDDMAQRSLEMELPKSNPRAIEELRQYIELATKTNKQIVLSELIRKRFANRPYGWPELEVVLLLARLYAVGEIQFQMAGSLLARERVYKAITTSAKWPKIVVHQRLSTRPGELQKARQLGKGVFAEMGPDNEEALYQFLRAKAAGWASNLSAYRPLAETGNYPGREEIAEGQSLLGALLILDESNRFLARFLERGDELTEFADRYHELDNFYQHQRPSWDRLQAAVARFELNRLELERDEEASASLRRMAEILAVPSPYGLVQETDGLIRRVSAVNDALVVQVREEVLATVAEQSTDLQWNLSAAGAPDELREMCLGQLEQVRSRIDSQESVAHILQLAAEAQRLRDAALNRIDKHLAAKAAEVKSAGKETVAEPRVKPRRLVEPAKLVGPAYLETPAEIETFLADLRQALEAALEAGERIEIR